MKESMGIGGHMETGALVKDGRSDRTSLVAETDVRGPPVGGRWEGGEKAWVMEGTSKSSFESEEGKERACYLSRAGHGWGEQLLWECMCEGPSRHGGFAGSNWFIIATSEQASLGVYDIAITSFVFFSFVCCWSFSSTSSLDLICLLGTAFAVIGVCEESSADLSLSLSLFTTPHLWGLFYEIIIES